MKILGIVFLLFYTSTVFAATDGLQPNWFKDSFLDLREDIAEATAEGKRIMLYFHQNGCPYCKRLDVENFGNPDIAAHTQRLYQVIDFNMWGDREIVDLDGNNLTEKTFAESMKVMYTPTLIFLDEQGEVALRVNGYFGQQRFRYALDFASAQNTFKGNFAAYVRSQQKGAVAGGKMIEEDYFLQPPHNLSRNKLKGKYPLLVLFEKPDCAGCVTAHRKIMKKKLTLELLDKFDVVQINTEGKRPVITPAGVKETESSWADKLGILYTPSLVFFDEGGQEVFRAGALLWTFHFQSALDYVSSGKYKTQPSFQRFIQARAEHLMEQGVEIKLVDD